MRLSERLEKIISLLRPCRCLADIGTDHGFIPIEAVRRGIASGALACDVRKGPLLRAEEHIGTAGFSEKIGVRLGDGLMPIIPGEADTIVIAGMGGRLMCRLLEEGRERLFDGDGRPRVTQLILSPHSDVPAVRACAAGLGFRIEDEDVVSEDGKTYFYLSCAPMKGKSGSIENDVIVPFSAETGTDSDIKPGSAAGTQGENLYTDTELEFGPVLLSKRPPVWLAYLEEKKRRNDQVAEKLAAAPDTPENRLTAEKLRAENERIENVKNQRLQY